MEPDHCANIAELLLRYPHLTLVGNAKTFAFVSQFYDLDLTGRTLTVKEGDTLCLGSHTLHFFLAPMVHWPEVMVSYEETEHRCIAKQCPCDGNPLRLSFGKPFSVIDA